MNQNWIKQQAVEKLLFGTIAALIGGLVVLIFDISQKNRNYLDEQVGILTQYNVEQFEKLRIQIDEPIVALANLRRGTLLTKELAQTLADEFSTTQIFFDSYIASIGTFEDERVKRFRTALNSCNALFVRDLVYNKLLDLKLAENRVLANRLRECIIATDGALVGFLQASAEYQRKSSSGNQQAIILGLGIFQLYFILLLGAVIGVVYLYKTAPRN